MTGSWAILRLLRPREWVKNGFVLVGLIFGHGLDHPDLLGRAALLFAAFCLVSSAVYAMNDVMDREADRAHPSKRNRPVASGDLPPGAAISIAVAFAVLGLALAWWISAIALVAAACYVIVNIGYSAGLKHVPILDVFLIAAGFMLRILAGTAGLDIPPSNWLFLCGLMLTVFLGFSKRRAELLALGPRATRHATAAQRRALVGYRPRLLDRLIAISAAGTIIAYGLYTVDRETIRLHGTDGLVFTVPFVIYGVFRYLHMLYRARGGADPATELLGDPHLLVATAGWLVVVLWLIA